MKKLFVLTFALFSVFASCSNLDGGSNDGANSARLVTVTGSFNMSGAVPEEIAALKSAGTTSLNFTRERRLV